MNDKRKAFFDKIYEKYSRSAMEVAISVLNDIELAQDACQLAFSYIAQNIDKISHNPEKSKNYVLKVTRHFAIDEYRRNKYIRSHENLIIDSEEDDEGNHSLQNTAFFSIESFEDMVLKKIEMLDLWNVLCKLDDKHLSIVNGQTGTSSISLTVYLEKLVNGSWQPYTSWSHSGGIDLSNTDTTNVSHGAYRVWMSVTATAPGYGSESFNVDGNTVGY